ncbi:MAG: efflux RND transporter permease subunit [Paracoccaceae bacterium]
MNFSSWAIRYPVPPILVFMLLTLTGIMAFQRLEVQNFPDMELPMISISASLDGAAAAQARNRGRAQIEDQASPASR